MKQWDCRVVRSPHRWSPVVGGVFVVLASISVATITAAAPTDRCVIDGATVWVDEDGGVRPGPDGRVERPGLDGRCAFDLVNARGRFCVNAQDGEVLRMDDDRWYSVGRCRHVTDRCVIDGNELFIDDSDVVAAPNVPRQARVDRPGQDVRCAFDIIGPFGRYCVNRDDGEVLRPDERGWHSVGNCRHR